MSKCSTLVDQLSLRPTDGYLHSSKAYITINLIKGIYLFYMHGILSACMLVSHVCSAHGFWQKVSHSFGLELQMTVSQHVGCQEENMSFLAETNPVFSNLSMVTVFYHSNRSPNKDRCVTSSEKTAWLSPD